MTGDPLNYTEFSRRWVEGADFTVRVLDRLTPFAVLAPHGGEIEPGTSEIAGALAGEDYSLYCLEGLRLDQNAPLHLPSRYFDEVRCLRLLLGARVALSVHGCQGDAPLTWVGGLDCNLRDRMIAGLLASGFNARLDTTRHAGLHRRNVCNRARSGRGLQLEISRGQRVAFFSSLSRPGRQNPTPLLQNYIQTIRSVLAMLVK